MSTVATSIEDRVKTILTAQFALGCEVQMDALLDGEYGMDDLDLLEITMSVEDEFGIEIDDDAMNALKTARDIVNCVTARVK